MLAQLVEAAFRSIALGSVVWLGLRVFRVRNPQIRMTSWTVVLAISLAMPMLTPRMKVTIPASEPPTRLEKIAWSDIPPLILLRPAASGEQAAAGALPSGTGKPALAWGADWRFIATGIYLFTGGILFLRLFVGLMLMRSIVRKACPVNVPWARGADIRVSSRVTVPVTFASTILVPSGYTAWSERKLQAVLWHEGSHVAHGDFYVLLLAAIHRVVFWFNPFAWWLSAHLARLAEMVSDDAAIAGLCDSRCYADILIDMAKTARHLPAGLAMARSSTVPWRVERILAAAVVPAGIGPRQRLLTAAMLVPLAALSAVSVVKRAAPRLPALAMPAADTLIASDLAQLDRYTGQFEIRPMSVLTVSRQGEELFAQLTGQPKLRLIALGGHEFADEFGDSNITFVLGGEGPAPEAALRQRNHGLRPGTRIDVALAGGIEAAFNRRMATAPDRFRDQTPVPGSEAALRQTIEDLRRGNPDFEGMSPQLAGKLLKNLSYLQASLGLFGAVDTISFKGVAPGGYDVYGVTFAKGSAEFRIDLAPGGTLEDITFRPDGDATQGGVAPCAIEPALNFSPGTVPVRLSLTNRSGTAIRLFWLNDAGRRVSRGTLDENASTYIWTYIRQPWVITDLSGQCREIVLPGQLTRFHVAAALPSGGRPGFTAAQRTSQFAGSEEALRRHIDDIRRGTLNYDRMTSEAAAATRQSLSQRQIILDKLGKLQAMMFRGVSLSGNDIYKVQFSNGAAEWQIGLLDDGRIASIGLGPQF